MVSKSLFPSVRHRLRIREKALGGSSQCNQNTAQLKYPLILRVKESPSGYESACSQKRFGLVVGRPYGIDAVRVDCSSEECRWI